MHQSRGVSVRASRPHRPFSFVGALLRAHGPLPASLPSWAVLTRSLRVGLLATHPLGSPASGNFFAAAVPGLLLLCQQCRVHHGSPMDPSKWFQKAVVCHLRV